MEQHHGSKILESERLILRPLCADDACEAFATWTSDPEVTRYMRWSAHKNAGETREYFSKCEKEYARPDYYHWGITLRETGALIGSIGAFPAKDEPNRHECGYCIGRAYWGNGYTTEALCRMMEYLIREVGLRRFVCSHAKENPASGAVMRRAGFVYARDGSYKSFDGARTFESSIYYLDIDEQENLHG